MEKLCGKCDTTKPLDEFYRDKVKRLGRTSWCKKCCSEYNKSPRGHARDKRYKQSKKGRRNQYRCNHSLKGYAKFHRYWQSDRYAKVRAAYVEKERNEHPEKFQARLALRHAVQDGKIDKPDTCENCGEYHPLLHGHHHSYEKEYWLDVIWLCPGCHKRVYHASSSELA